MLPQPKYLASNQPSPQFTCSPTFAAFWHDVWKCHHWCRWQVSTLYCLWEKTQKLESIRWTHDQQNGVDNTDCDIWFCGWPFLGFVVSCVLFLCLGWKHLYFSSLTQEASLSHLDLICSRDSFLPKMIHLSSLLLTRIESTVCFCVVWSWMHGLFLGSHFSWIFYELHRDYHKSDPWFGHFAYYLI
jgi:hypothetical protein